MPNLKLTKTYRILTLERVHDELIQCIFTYMAGFVVKFPNSGRINPVTMALAIFLKLYAQIISLGKFISGSDYLSTVFGFKKPQKKR